MSTFRRLALTLTLGVALAGLAGCTHLAYHPTDLMYVQHLEKYPHEEVSFKSLDGTPLAGWLFKSERASRGVIVQFHGNGENMTSHFAAVHWLVAEGYDVFTFDYRGYGISEGNPTQEGLNSDALAAIQYILKREPPSKSGEPDITLYGQSLGGAVLLRAYADVRETDRKRVRALVVESSFQDYHAIAANILRRSWVTFLFQPLAYVLVSNQYSPEDYIAGYSPTPILVIHGDSDPVIPLKFGQKIFELAKEPKRFLLIPGGRHIEGMAINHGQYRPALLEFLAHPPAVAPAVTNPQ